MQSIQLGPFTFATSLFAFMVAALLGLFLAAWLDRRKQTRAESVLWRAIILGVVIGRLGFLIQQWNFYQSEPLSWLDLRDGGLMIPAAVTAGWFYVLWRVLRDKAVLPAAAGGLAVGVAAFSLIMVVTGKGQAEPTQPLPEIDLIPMQAQFRAPESLDQYQGKVTVVNLWASWCPPCRREMPAFKQVQSSRSDVNIVFANQGEELDVIQKYLNEENLDLGNMWRDPQMKLGQAVRSRGLPTTLFLDEQGRLVDVRAGELSAATLNDKINKLK
ncbi:thiol:disulfide interchange protein [Alcaligenes pakistanensis]|uniref:Thiol:disulfide interchange protein n=1 Tax=Alcaligenes pakistanensis TaxID=1482717 RepID=A0A8H9IFW6_9BURK|nr:TlpA disulfide reductase family protein [Alcaligenes pakistanensis]GHC36810.1 thiol:disulfide interchange protein [Alcaligenes pakistanensis]HCA18987.1 thiol:disulfide interchange protein [Alcaligenes faecalis]